MNNLLRDLGYSLRLLRKNPLFSITAIAIVGLGLGANTLIFSVINGVLLNPLPYRDADRVVMLWWDSSRGGGQQRNSAAPADFADLQKRTRSFESMAAFRNDSYTFTALDQPVTPLTHSVTANYFDTLGVSALHGRTFASGEDRTGHEQVAMISYSLWQEAFGGDKAVIGRDIELDSRKYQLIGVLPANFHSANLFAVQPDLWVPLPLENSTQDRSTRSLGIVARLKPGVSLADASSDAALVGAQIVRDNPRTNAGSGVIVRSIREDLVGQFRPTLRLLFAAVGFVLLIACANVANLLLVRALSRSKEMALRSALGAGRGEILRQLLIESLMLSAFGALAGLTLASWGIQPVLSFIPASAGMPFLNTVGIDAKVAAFTLALSLFTGMLFGMVPALQGMRTSLAEVLREAGRSGSGGRGSQRMRGGLMVAEVALSFMLLAGAALVLQSSWKLAHLDPGFDAHNVLTMRNSLRGAQYATPASRRAHFQNAVRKLASLPGVEGASGVGFAPPLGTAFSGMHFVRSDKPAQPGEEPTAIPLPVMPNYFEVMRIPLLSGRTISDRDTDESAHVAVISRAFAEQYFPGEDPIDKSVEFRPLSPGGWKIVGVVGDQRFAGVDPTPKPVAFFPHTQLPAPIMAFVLRTTQSPMSIAGAAQKEVWSLGKMMNVYQVRTLDQSLAESDWQARFTALLLAGFAALALVLTAAGMYAVISYSVSQRTHEIGIRIALGARPWDVLQMVLRQGVLLTLAGVALGVVGSLAVGRVLANTLYGVRPEDPWTMVAVAAMLVTVAAIACATPARKASATDPNRVLHHL